MTARLRRTAAAVTRRARCASLSVSSCSVEPGRRDRLRRRRHAGHLQHQHRRRCGVGRAAGVRPRADRVQLPRPGRPDRRRPRLRHHLGGRPRAAGARLRDQRQGGVLRRQADHLRRHGAGLGVAVGPVSRRSTRPAGPATATSPPSTARPGRRRPGCRSRTDRAFVDFGQLFAATSMMPSHVIADELGVDVTTAHSQQRRAGHRPHRAGVEHHLEPDPRPRPEAVPVVGPLQAGIGRPRTARWCWSPTTSGGAPSPSPTRSPSGRAAPTSRTASTTAAFDVVDVATGSSGTLNLPDDYARTDTPSAGIEQLIFARAGTDGRPAGPPRAGAVHPARRDRPQRRGADRQRAAQPGDRGCGRTRPRRSEAGAVRRRQSRRRPGGARRTAADRAHRLPDPQRAAGRDRRCDRQVVRACGHHRAGRRLRTPPAR